MNTRFSKLHFSHFATTCLFVGALTCHAFACDTCSIYTPLDARELIAGAGSGSVAVELDGYSKTRLDGSKYLDGENGKSQSHKITVSELEATYDVSSHFGLQVDVPFVFQKYTRLEDGAFQSGSDQGIGDVALYARVSPYQASRGDSSFIFQLIGGAKLPTGDTAALQEQKNPSLSQTGIYGADLALGTGSTDVPLAASIASVIHSWTLGGTVQYNLRSEGDYSYQVGNDLRWNAYLGKRLDMEKQATLEPRFRLSGITKGRDSQNGTDLTDSGLSEIAVGPQIILQIGNSAAFDLTADIPVTYDNNGVQALADHRIRLNLTVNL